MKRLIKWFGLLLLSALLIFILYCNNLSLANRKTVTFYSELKRQLVENGYRPRLLVISTKRFSWHNQLQVWLSGAATNSRHLRGDAIDFLVLDINRDGKANSLDVDIAVELLEKKIMKGGGGIGTYKHESSFINRQMIHIDCREGRSRW